MTDLLLFGAWLLVLALALSGLAWAHRRGADAHLLRDALHIGAGIWVFGWGAWNSAAPPLAIVGLAFAGAALVPSLASHHPKIDRFRKSVVADDERWAGIVLYVGSFALFTAIGVLVTPFAAAAALLALSLGDGIGGLVGRTIGRLEYVAWGAKKKSLEGSLAVAVAAALGVFAAAVAFDVEINPVLVVASGVIAAGVEAISPRSTDNALLPAAVWIFLLVTTNTEVAS
jgi:dolichol kinase